MPFRQFIVGFTVLLTIAAGCTSVSRPADERLVADVMVQWETAMTAYDIDGVMALFSENFKGPLKSTRDDVRLALEYGLPMMIISGGSAVDTSAMTIKVGKKTATAGPITIAAGTRQLTIKYKLAKENDGIWRITGSGSN